MAGNADGWDLEQDHSPTEARFRPVIRALLGVASRHNENVRAD